jgi:hypothetical protein
MWRPERVVRVEGCGGVAGGATAGVALTGLKVLFPLSVPKRMLAGLTLSVDMVMGLPCTRSSSIFSLHDRTW